MKTKGYLLLAFTVLSFSTMEVVSAPLKGHLDPFSITFLRFLMGGLFLLPFAIWRKEKVSKKDLGFLFLLGGLNGFLSMSCLQLSVFYGKASTTAMLISSNPIFVMLFSVFILKEKLTGKRLLAICFGVVGLVIIGSRFGTGGDTLAGILFGVLAALTFGLYTVLSKKKSDTVGSLALIAYSSLFACLFYIPLFIWKEIQPFQFPSGSLIPLLYLGIVLSGLAYITYMEALKILGAGKGSVTFFLKPAIASVLAVIFLGEHLKWSAILGSAVIIAGMAVNFWPEKKKKF